MSNLVNTNNIVRYDYTITITLNLYIIIYKFYHIIYISTTY